MFYLSRLYSTTSFAKTHTQNNTNLLPSHSTTLAGKSCRKSNFDADWFEVMVDVSRHTHAITFLSLQFDTCTTNIVSIKTLPVQDIHFSSKGNKWDVRISWLLAMHFYVWHIVTIHKNATTVYSKEKLLWHSVNTWLHATWARVWFSFRFFRCFENFKIAKLKFKSWFEHFSEE